MSPETDPSGRAPIRPKAAMGSLFGAIDQASSYRAAAPPTVNRSSLRAPVTLAVCEKVDESPGRGVDRASEWKIKGAGRV